MHLTTKKSVRQTCLKVDCDRWGSLALISNLHNHGGQWLILSLTHWVVAPSLFPSKTTVVSVKSVQACCAKSKRS